MGKDPGSIREGEPAIYDVPRGQKTDVMHSVPDSEYHVLSRGWWGWEGASCENTLPSSRCRVERDRVAKALEANSKPLCNGFAVALVEGALTEIPKDVTVAEQTMGDDEDGIADRDRRPLRASPCGEPVVLRRRIRSLAASRRAGNPEPVALSLPRSCVLAPPSRVVH